MMLSDDNRSSRVMITLLMVPMIIAPVAAGTLWRMMVDRTYGVINYIITLVGLQPVHARATAGIRACLSGGCFARWAVDCLENLEQPVLLGDHLVGFPLLDPVKVRMAGPAGRAPAREHGLGTAPRARGR